jgi:hypothetical protein
MKRLAVRVAVTILTFIIGVTIVVLWLKSPQRRFADDVYFPVGAFNPHEDERNWTAKFYSSTLAAMQEPPIFPARDEKLEAYRFLWLRSFHPPVSVRVWRNHEQAWMSVKQLSAGGVPVNGEVIFTGGLTVNDTRPMTEEEWGHFQELLMKSEFWTMPSEDGTERVLDGAGWLLEGVNANRYHVVNRQSPKQGDYREACVYLLRISGVKIDEPAGELY